MKTYKVSIPMECHLVVDVELPDCLTPTRKQLMTIARDRASHGETAFGELLSEDKWTVHDEKGKELT